MNVSFNEIDQKKVQHVFHFLQSLGVAHSITFDLVLGDNEEFEEEYEGECP